MSGGYCPKLQVVKNIKPRINIKRLAAFAAFFLTAAIVSAFYYPITAFFDETTSKSNGLSYDAHVEAWNNAGYSESCVVEVYLVVKNQNNQTIAEFEATLSVDSGGYVSVSQEGTGFSHTGYFNPGLRSEATLDITYSPPEGVTNYTVEMIVTPTMDPFYCGGYVSGG